ncbi:MAG: DUF3604 domain-containing protein [Robiginitalea sp.]
MLGFIFMAGCGPDQKNADSAQESDTPAMADVSVNPDKDVYFGNLHVHTRWSFDAYINGAATDPEFDASEHAYYYARVIQIPTPRWSTYDAKRLGVAPREDLPVSI